MSGACQSGCKSRGKHLGDCSDPECWGCVPRQASFGVLCGWCWQKLQGSVVDVPAATAHLVSVAHSPLKSSSRVSSGTGPPGSVVLWSPALDAADELVAALGSWADLIVAEHPAGLRGPSQIGWRWSTRAARVVDGEVIVRDEQRLGASQSAVDHLVKWMLPHMEWVSEQSWAPEMRLELSSMLATIWARWPREERPRWSVVPCPSCSGPLAYDPPSQFGLQGRTYCVSEECGQVWSESEWRWLAESMSGGSSV